KTLVNKFKSEYNRPENPKSRRSPVIIFDFDTLWPSTWVNKILASERDKVSVALIKTSSAEKTTGKHQVNKVLWYKYLAKKNDDREVNSVNWGDGYSNQRSDDATDENLLCICNNYKGYFTSIISSDERVPGYLKQFELFQLKALKKSKTVGLLRHIYIRSSKYMHAVKGRLVVILKSIN
ncbi:hypothetical protein CLU79DRAFT_712820, partial [Phycomyces nitens]